MAALGADKRAEIEEVTEMLTSNLEKIVEHGQRADGIVRSMLAHSRGGAGDWQTVDLNGLVEEALNLAYHGARAQDQNFNITLERDFDSALAPIEVVPQEVVVADVDADGVVHVWASNKVPFALRRYLARALDLPLEGIVIHPLAVGGDFGGKGSFMDIPLAFFLAQASGRAVKMAMSYTDELTAGNPRHAGDTHSFRVEPIRPRELARARPRPRADRRRRR